MHHIELELQNEELRRVQVQLETERARHFDLYDVAPVGYITASETGLIIEANLTAATLLGLDTFYCDFRVVLPRQGLRWRWSQAHSGADGA